MLKTASFLSQSSLALLAACSIGLIATPALAAPPASVAPSVINLQANVLQSNGTYLWSYSVNGGNKPALSHWVLGLDSCLLEHWSSIAVAGSVSETPFEIRIAPDPKTGATGIKFDKGYDDSEVRTVSFRLMESYTTVMQTAAFKAGQNITTQQVLAPGESLDPNGACATDAVPEPSTLGLLALAPLAIVVARRRHAK